MTSWPEVWNAVWEINPHYSLSQEELAFLIEHALLVPARGQVLELGICHGRTLAALTLATEAQEASVTGIDHFGLEGSVWQVRESLARVGASRAVVIVGDTRVIPWDIPLDLLLVDAGHDEANVSKDVRKYVPLVKPGGLVFFHDWDPEVDPASPHEAVRRHATAACGDWEDLGLVGGLKGFRRPLL
jgi:predicted O-methyltransferase YrrM